MKYQIKDFGCNKLLESASHITTAGLDIGSRTSKGIILNDGVIYAALIPTGLYMQETADELLAKLLQKSVLERRDIRRIVCTGYGRISTAFDDIPFGVVTEISCHAMGVHFLHPNTQTIIDIGGQDSKAIRLNPATGAVVDFVMNDKCAAGTGQFLEKSAILLGLNLDEMGRLALCATKPSQISSQCVVFAESEIISLRAKGARHNDAETVPNLAAGIHHSAARRVHNLLHRVGPEPELMFTGGVSRNPGMRHILQEMMGASFTLTPFDMTFAGALGAAVYARTHKKELSSKGVPARALEATPISKLINDAQASFVAKQDGRKRIGYLCAFTPIELLNAAGVRHVRLFKAGGPGVVSAGELFTQSVFCDFSKSCIGFFQTGDPIYKALDKVYSFHTCGSMKRVSEILDQFAPTKMLNLPKLRDSLQSREFFRNELLNLKQDLESITGREIQDGAVGEQIVLYNKLRRLLKNISELRKRAHPPIRGSEFIELVRGYYYIPPEDLLPVCQDIYTQREAAPDNESSGRFRIMAAGSIMADGDRKLLELVENEFGLQVVVEDHCAGVKPFYQTIAENLDLYRALADGYMDQAPCARMKTLDDSVEFAGRLAQEYRADGVLYVSLKFCSCYGVSKKGFLDHFQKLGIPLLDISSDYSVSDHGQLKTRVRAFIEMLAEKKERA
jgi:predicted CoA-substrate-specific enzyme activase